MATQHRRNIWWLLGFALLIAVMAAALGGAVHAAAAPLRPAVPSPPPPPESGAPAPRAAQTAPANPRAARDELRAAMHATPDARRGEDLYAPCGACHGADGRGVADGSVPAIAGQHYTVIAKQLVDFRHGGRWDIRMEHASQMAYLASGQDLADVALYVSSLPRGFTTGHGDGENLAVGVATYFAHCERCHGPLGEGDLERGIPRLAGQHYGYLYRQFFDAVEERRPSLGAGHQPLMEPLDRAQITGISDYLSRTATGLEPAPR